MDVESLETPDVGAEPEETQTAEAEGTQKSAEDAGTEPESTQSAEAEGTESDDKSTPEAAKAEPEGSEDGRGKHQVALEERVNQLAEKKFMELKAQFEAEQQRAQQQQPQYQEIDLEKLNGYLAAQMSEAEDARLEGNVIKALELEDHVRQLMADYRANEAKKAQWLEQQNEVKRLDGVREWHQQQNIKATEFVRTHLNIPQEVFEQGRTWFDEQQTKDPILRERYNSIVMHQGHLEGMLWAVKYVEDNMGKGAKTDIDAKNEAKKTALSVASGATEGKANEPKTWDDLMKLTGPEIVKFQRENPKGFAKLNNTRS